MQHLTASAELNASLGWEVLPQPYSTEQFPCDYYCGEAGLNLHIFLPPPEQTITAIWLILSLPTGQGHWLSGDYVGNKYMCTVTQFKLICCVCSMSDHLQETSDSALICDVYRE